MNREELIRDHDKALERRLDLLGNVAIPLSNGTMYHPPTLEEAHRIYRRLVRLAANHLNSCAFASVVVPASGGADSTFMLKILRDAADLIAREGKLPGSSFKYDAPKIIGFTLRCDLQADAEYLDDMGRWACELYADDYSCIDLTEAFNFWMANVFNTFDIPMEKSDRSLGDLFVELNPGYPDREHRVDRGNVAARMRMIFAYGLAKMLHGAPCSTDNLSEGLTGFWTLCGDEGTFKYMQGIWKGLELPVIMHAAGVPSPFFMQLETDGLGVGDGDCSQLYGALWDGTQTYVDVDIVLMNYLDGKEYPDPKYPDVKAKVHPVVRWHVGTDFKRNVFTLGRSDLGLTKMPGLNFAC